VTASPVRYPDTGKLESGRLRVGIFKRNWSALKCAKATEQGTAVIQCVDGGRGTSHCCGLLDGHVDTAG